ncbi:hypothetical protein LVD15_24605 [Fulvivirga maritima]|uniref:fibronectin type III domain-containing protein n=1 Tax=Fulvivirga maritima TaxID=2904247 RepID=UPI001F2EA839|nr:fibronectin type III domain-containing protein [Fulvivirga maritima]UII26439.1 hypothetical protein LVD15_24605 [Fulvivirga maritima]
MLLICCRVGFSQTYPVQVNTTIIPPYSVYLADYVAPGSERLSLNVMLGDIARPELQTRLRLRIEGQGILIETKPGYLPPPLILQGGIPERLTSADLVDYFKPENLNFQGITRQEFERGGALPEGLYQFCFEVLEYNRGVRISNSGCATAWLIMNDPPIINVPFNGEKIRPQDPQYVTLQWTPRHTGSPNSAFVTEYEVTMVEIWPDNRNPNDAILTSPPIFQATTQATTIIYGPAETPLELGRRYAFRVQAKSLVGIDELDLFKNNGYSEVFTFVYGDECKTLNVIDAESLSTSRASIAWEPLPNHTAFNVRYRVADSDDQWLEENIYLNDIELNSLEPGTTYEYQVAPSCGSFSGEYSLLAEVTTNEPIEGEFVCGGDEGDYNLENTELIDQLNPGDYIYAGDFDIKLDSVSGVDGKFRGGGKAEIPFLNYVKVRVTFENIEVNTDHRVIKGNVYTYWDPASSMMYTSPTPEEGAAGEDAISEGEDGDGNTEGSENTYDSLSIDGEIAEIYQDSTGNVIVVTTTGDTTTVAAGEDVVYTDSNGNQTIVGPSGTTEFNSSNGGGASSGAGNSAIAGADFQLGPISFRLNDELSSSETDEEGYCVYNDVDVSFILTLLGQDELSAEVTIENASLSFKKKCDGEEFKEVTVTYSNTSGLSLGKIGFIDAALTGAELTIDADGNLGGEVALSAALNEDQVIQDYIRINQGVTGSFAFAFSNSTDFSGSFDFQGVQDINIDLLKGDQELASLSNGQLAADGSFSGQIAAAENQISYPIQGASVLVNSLTADVTYSVTGELEMTSGSGLFTLSNVAGLQGDIQLGLEMNGGQYTSSVNSSSLTGYGMTFSDLDFSVEIDEAFNINSISGAFKAKHNQFSAALDIQEFEIKDGVLAKFKGLGQVNYDGITVNVLSTEYNAEARSLSLSAAALVESNGLKIAAEISDFTIDYEGNITMGSYEVQGAGDLIFGPVRVALEANANNVGSADEGWNSYEASATVFLKMEGEKDQKEAELGAASLKFQQNSATGEFKNVDITWTSEQGIDLGNVGKIGGILKNAHLTIDEENKLAGELGIKAYLNEDIVIQETFIIHSGLSGDFKFTYAGDNSFDGLFDMEGVTGINLDFKKSDKVLASLENGVLDKDGKLSGTLSALQNEEVNISGFSMKVDELEMDIEYSSFEALNVKTGHGLFTVSDIKGLDGTVQLGLAIQNDSYVTTIAASNLGGYGFTFSELNLTADFSESFELNKVSGSVKVKHSEFDTEIAINDFLIEEGELKSFIGSGNIIYNNLSISISKTTYSSETGLIEIDGSVELEQQGLNIAATISGFTVNREGVITPGDYNVNVSGTLTFGDVTVALTSEVEELENSGNYRPYSAEASVSLKMKQGNKIKEKALANVKVAFEKHKTKDRYRNVSVSVSDKNVPLGELYGINVAIKSAQINISTEESYLSGTAEDADNASISGNSFVKLGVSLTEDKTLTPLIKVKKGVSGEITFKYDGGDDFEGVFDVSQVKNLNIIAQKGDTELAALNDAQIDAQGKLTGTLTALEGANFSTGNFDMQVEKLEFGISADLNESWDTFELLSGEGKFKVNEISGIDGHFYVNFNYGVDGNFNTSVTSDSEIKAFGMLLNDLALEADFDQSLTLETISGTMKAKHESFDASLSVERFKIDNGRITEWNATGDVRYKKFGFELLSSTYNGSVMSVSAKVELNDVGKVQVDNFSIDSEGNISVGSIEGEIKKPMVDVDFSAQFREEGFKGDFNADIRMIQLSGAVDFGVTPSFNYAYLSMAVGARTGVPLGPTGLQLTKVGGQVGYNYYLNYVSGSFRGEPRPNNYLLGLTLGISDVSNMFAAEGTTVVQFGGDNLQLSLSGDIQAPRNNPVIRSGFDVNYYLPDNTLDGDLSIDVNVPPSTGYVFSTVTPANLGFNYSSNGWHVEGNVNAQFFREVNFIGNTSFTRESSNISGSLQGTASYSYMKTFNYEVVGVTINGGMELGFSSNVNASLDANGLQGEVAVTLYGNANLIIDAPIIPEVTGRVSVVCQGRMSYTNGVGKIRGDAHVVIEAVGLSEEGTISIEKSF